MSNIIPYMIVMAVVTYAIRMIPLTFCQKPIQSTFIKSFLFYVPYAVLGAMTFPAIFTSIGREASQIFASAFGCMVAIYLSYRGKSLIIVAIAACVVAYAFQYLVTI